MTHQNGNQAEGPTSTSEPLCRQSRLPAWNRARLVSLALLLFTLAVTFAVYVRVISGEFQFDDDAHITDALDVGGHLRKMATGYLSMLVSSARPVTVLTFALNHAYGGLAVEGYHLVNIAFHLATVVAVYFFVRRLLALPALVGEFGDSARWVALLASALFALHPLQTMAVSYVVQRAEIIASLFYLLSLLAFLAAFERHGAAALPHYLAGFVLFLIGWGGKEIVVTLFLALVVVTAYLGSRELLRRSLALAAPLLVVGAWIGIRAVKRFSGRGDVGFDIAGMGQPEYLYTQVSVLWTYVRLIFWPTGQTVDYDYPVYSEFWTLPVAGGALLWLLVLAVCVWALRYRGDWTAHVRLAAFGIVWFVILLAPTSSLIPLRDLIFEHRVYLAQLGIIVSFLALADILRRKLAEGSSRRAVAVATTISACAILAALAVATWQRNAVWESKMALWTDAARKAPGKSRVQNNVGNCFYLKGELLPAITHYLEAIRLDPGNREPYYNAALIYSSIGRQADAERYLAEFKRLGGIPAGQ